MTSCLPSCTSSLFCKGVYTKRKEFAHYWNNHFPPFLSRLIFCSVCLFFFVCFFVFFFFFFWGGGLFCCCFLLLFFCFVLFFCCCYCCCSEGRQSNFTRVTALESVSIHFNSAIINNPCKIIIVVIVNLRFGISCQLRKKIFINLSSVVIVQRTLKAKNTFIYRFQTYALS